MIDRFEQWLGAAAHTDKNIEAGYGCGDLSGCGYGSGNGNGYGSCIGRGYGYSPGNGRGCGYGLSISRKYQGYGCGLADGSVAYGEIGGQHEH